jgi:hypothetical protein
LITMMFCPVPICQTPRGADTDRFHPDSGIFPKAFSPGLETDILVT